MSQELQDDAVVTNSAVLNKARTDAAAMNGPRLKQGPFFTQDKTGRVTTASGGEFMFIPSRLPGQKEAEK